MGTSRDLVPTVDAAQRLNVTPRTVRRWVASGHLPGQKIGRILVADGPAVAALEQRGRQGSGVRR